MFLRVDCNLPATTVEKLPGTVDIVDQSPVFVFGGESSGSKDENLSCLDEVRFLHRFLCEDAVLIRVVYLNEKCLDWGFRVVGFLHAVLVILQVCWSDLAIFGEKRIEDRPEVGCCTAYEVMIEMFPKGWLDSG